MLEQWGREMPARDSAKMGGWCPHLRVGVGGVRPQELSLRA